MKIFYNDRQSCAEANGYSPSASKPALFLADTLQHFTGVQVIKSGKASFIDFYRAHKQSFIEGVLNGTIDNGFDNRSMAVAATLPYTSGSLLDAAHHAVAENEHTLAPVSGFHHAGYDFAGGFCTFNGLVVAAATLYQSDMVKKVGILDIDAHAGNGTADIIRRKKLDYIVHKSFGYAFCDPSDCADGRFEAWLDRAIASMADVDLVLYQAGADPHVNDALGGFLTTEQMYQRDLTVFRAFKGKPLAITLAGGYQRDSRGGIEPVLALHRNTVKAWHEVHA